MALAAPYIEQKGLNSYDKPLCSSFSGPSQVSSPSQSPQKQAVLFSPPDSPAAEVSSTVGGGEIEWSVGAWELEET